MHATLLPQLDLTVLDFQRPQLVLDLVGVFVFSLSGALVAVRKRLDLFGILVLACLAALGGGVLRDVLLGVTPPVGISDWRLLAAAALGGVVVFAYSPGVERVSRLVTVLDAAGLGLFATSGALKAVTQPDIPAVAAVLVGLVTAIGGGVLRDVVAGQVPEVLRRELYAIPAALGSIVVVTAAQLGSLNDLVLWAAVLVVFGLRMTAVRLDLNAPQSLRSFR